MDCTVFHLRLKGPQNNCDIFREVIQCQILHQDTSYLRFCRIEAVTDNTAFGGRPKKLSVKLGIPSSASYLKNNSAKFL